MREHLSVEGVQLIKENTKKGITISIVPYGFQSPIVKVMKVKSAIDGTWLPAFMEWKSSRNQPGLIAVHFAHALRVGARCCGKLDESNV